MSDYYTTTGKKVGDFLMGFFGVWVISGLLSFIIAIINSFIFMNNYTIQGWIAGISFVITIILYIVAIVLAFHFKRHYIAIGTISSFVVPLLVVGACFAVFWGMSLM
ncbi:MAG: hypothetical protein A2Y03_10695 [Omnitrophica WOR_2 bacterium GWF2_38_59]|nr:MAG: hypothetical protein A2Y03_10695 [Omnitrophica WOR_2 bacterium GWF2_38_59]OGX50653.1 MAG: hypothetical protein A2243_03540 [Omnitrophica WOR_2 bacterium RIFOXYA2_FULL_38_17]OGX56166.1 MAG: hypothetical protein A2447_07870 [Omnitrophica WOR_2 bacterium RIFOXYC2_FULL_38_12]OGX60399.1 MAG: hypothetical protein A2306_09090 [Omnitrophica WOR_2 bacterium RIFOXYB2_FULL_38_16]HBG60929.1 hypothetical protein [Candidatus Omnitrophota bacterium]